MDSNLKGTIAEHAIALAAAKLQVPVWRPTSDHARADLVLEVQKRLLRVQCKWGRLSPDRTSVIAHIGGS